MVKLCTFWCRNQELKVFGSDSDKDNKKKTKVATETQVDLLLIRKIDGCKVMNFWKFTEWSGEKRAGGDWCSGKPYREHNKNGSRERGKAPDPAGVNKWYAEIRNNLHKGVFKYILESIGERGINYQKGW